MERLSEPVNRVPMLRRSRAFGVRWLRRMEEVPDPLVRAATPSTGRAAERTGCERTDPGGPGRGRPTYRGGVGEDGTARCRWWTTTRRCATWCGAAWSGPRELASTSRVTRSRAMAVSSTDVPSSAARSPACPGRRHRGPPSPPGGRPRRRRQRPGDGRRVGDGTDDESVAAEVARPAPRVAGRSQQVEQDQLVVARPASRSATCELTNPARHGPPRRRDRVRFRPARRAAHPGPRPPGVRPPGSDWFA
jgi:hypothetical protein